MMKDRPTDTTPQTQEGAAMAEVNLIQARLDKLASLLATPGARGLDTIEMQAGTITGAIRIAIQTDPRRRSIYRIAADAGVSKAALGKFVKGEKDLNGATLDKLATVLGLELTAKGLPSKKL
jgi:hypothetical protein